MKKQKEVIIEDLMEEGYSKDQAEQIYKNRIMTALHLIQTANENITSTTRSLLMLSQVAHLDFNQENAFELIESLSKEIADHEDCKNIDVLIAVLSILLARMMTQIVEFQQECIVDMRAINHPSYP